MKKMSYEEVMSYLESNGSEQTRKTYKRHGADDHQFGVSFKEYKLLAKKIKKDHDLAIKLWDSGNLDARILSTMIADANQLSEERVDEWMSHLSFYMVIDQLVFNVISRTPWADIKRREWINSEDESLGRAGWDLVIDEAMHSPDQVDTYFEELLIKIEQEIHGSKNRKKEAMNSALIAIGMRNDALEDKAITVAERIGKVEIDHGDTACKTFDAKSYILKRKLS